MGVTSTTISIKGCLHQRKGQQSWSVITIDTDELEKSRTDKYWECFETHSPTFCSRNIFLFYDTDDKDQEIRDRVAEKKGIAKYHADEKFQAKEVRSQTVTKFFLHSVETSCVQYLKGNPTKLCPRKETVQRYRKMVLVINATLLMWKSTVNQFLVIMRVNRIMWM